MNKQFWVALETLMLIIWIVTLIIFLSQIWSKGTKCMANPLEYGANVLSFQNNNTDFSCNCKWGNAPEYTLFFNTTKSVVIKDFIQTESSNTPIIGDINITFIKGG